MNTFEKNGWVLWTSPVHVAQRKGRPPVPGAGDYSMISGAQLFWVMHKEAKTSIKDMNGSYLRKTADYPKGVSYSCWTNIQFVTSVTLKPA